MLEILSRFSRQPLIFAQCIAATLLINVLVLADTVFVMLVLRRYITSGVDGTLIILSAGILLCLIPLYGLSEARRALSERVSERSNAALSQKLSTVLQGISPASAASMSEADMRARWADFILLRNAYGPSAAAAVLDAPFALIFSAVIFLLHPFLGVIVLIWLTVLLLLNTLRRDHSEEASTEDPTALLASVMADPETAKLFGGAGHFRDRYSDMLQERAAHDARCADKAFPTVEKIVSVLGKTALYALGAKLVVMGELSVAALIGASLMAIYAERKLLALLKMAALFQKAKQAGKELEQFFAAGVEPSCSVLLGSGAAPFTKLSCRDVEYSYGDGPPVLRGFSLEAAPGTLTALSGPSGSGKSTAARLLVGLLQPEEGSVRLCSDEGGYLEASRIGACDRSRIFRYLPQEPYFLADTLGANISMGRKDISEADMMQALRRAGLKHFIESRRQGLDTPLSPSGAELPPGIRRRVSLAAAFLAPGNIIVMDEPVEGMDEEGAAFVYAALNDWMREGKSIVVAGNDPRIMKAAVQVVELGSAAPLRLAPCVVPGQRGAGA
jgi:ATP-binding cassette subfamily C protein LapB